ncbi:MAG: CHASE2 domain-containing protein [Candidatus Riflebacteria bacterium]|nr:CHASE2 domain-containing protein [Candidatus Riflebacteria bacterium]
MEINNIFSRILSKWRGEIRLFLSFFILFGFLSIFGVLDGLEVKTLDFRFRQRQPSSPSNDIVILAISDDCLSEIGKWPWSRNLHAKAIDMLKKAGAKAIVFDLIFQDPSDTNPDEDKNLIKACKDFGKIILPIHLVPVRIINPETLELTTEIEVFRPFNELASAAKTFGFINVDYQSLNPDGIIRRIPLTLEAQNQLFPALPLAIAKVVLNNVEICSEKLIKINENIIPILNIFSSQKIGSPNNWIFKPAFLINYLGEATSGAFGMVYYSDFLKGMLNPEIFRGKTVLIGPTATGLGDVKLTPFGEMPGVMIHANALQNLIHENFLLQVSPLTNIFILFLMGFLSLLIITRMGPISGIIIIVLLLVFYIFLALYVFLKFQIVMEMISPLSLTLFFFISCRFYQMFNSLKLAYQSIKKQNIALEYSNSMLDRQVKDLFVLNEVSKRLSSRLSMDLLTTEVLETFKGLWNASICVLLNADTDEFPPVVLGQIGIDESESNALLYEPEVSKFVKQIYEERKIITQPQGTWFTSYFPLLLGNRFWGAILLKENSPDPAIYQEREKYCQTLLGIAATALENARLYNLATVDALTKLYVRRYFQIQLEQEFKRAKRYSHDLSLLITDIDHFKKFNDTYGHQQGDIVLREVADRVKKSLREIDIPARYGGEEFGLILPETDMEGAVIVAERIRKNVEGLFVSRYQGGGEPLRVTISLGISSFKKHFPEAPEGMIKIADEGLYKAKAAGRNRVEII